MAEPDPRTAPPGANIATGPMPPDVHREGGRVTGADERERAHPADRASMRPREMAEADPTRTEGEKRAPGSYDPLVAGSIRHPEQNPPLNNPDDAGSDPVPEEQLKKAEENVSVTAYQKEVLEGTAPSPEEVQQNPTTDYSNQPQP